MNVVPVLSAAEAAAWDRLARERAAIPSRVLMESAGRAAAGVLAREYGRALDRGVLVACGTGNNGGDGWVLARALAAIGVGVTACQVPGELSGDADANRELALEHGVRVAGKGEEWGAQGVLVDALLGTGARGAPAGEVAAMVDRLQRHGSPIMAIDGPTGLDLSSGEVHAPCVRAHLTVTFGGFRRGHLLQRTICGRIVVVEMGFPPPDPSWPAAVGDLWVAEMLTPFTAEMHKGDRGRVLVIGGSDGMAGAAVFAARAAQRAGAGLARMAASEESVRAAQAGNPEIMTIATALGETPEPALAEAIAWADAIVLGPGLGRGGTRGAFVRAVLGAATCPLLLDADALLAFRGAAGELREALAGRRALLTPHRGEFAALFPDFGESARRDPFAAASRAAEQVGQAVLLKGVPTVIAAPGLPPLVSASGNPGLATGGTGDVLAGLAAAWLARGSPPQVAGAAAAWIHGRSAEDVAQHRSIRSLRPDDILGVLSPLWRELAEREREYLPPVLARLEPPELR
jgi:hydroxyethylthiazole kinase-like uncharacterized protein yjeF